MSGEAWLGWLGWSRESKRREILGEVGERCGGRFEGLYAQFEIEA
jgi:hypothetical protein